MNRMCEVLERNKNLRENVEQQARDMAVEYLDVDVCAKNMQSFTVKF